MVVILNKIAVAQCDGDSVGWLKKVVMVPLVGRGDGAAVLMMMVGIVVWTVTMLVA